ncbi:MAG TPA: PaaI family thioesterase [Thermoleophilaceae bacterium]|jgi:1,4-dihydroxy-2-naphthoyl-CoA hydrolase|nr:PaaI family thioesterase [Thermoleophilaceae bacterium]
MDSPIEGYPVAGTLDDVLGFELLESGPERCRARFAVEQRVQQPLGLVHGGAYAALAESMVSATTHMAVMGEGNFAVGQSNSTSFFRPATEGHVHAEGTPIHRGRSSWVWDVSFTDDEDRLCAASRVTIAVRPVKAP